MLPQRAGVPQVTNKMVYFTGSDTLAVGYALCYDQDASPTNADLKLRLGVAVEKPATANLNAFAGIVSESSDGVTGPAWVEIIVPTPNVIVNAYCHVNATAWTTAVAPADGDYGLVAFADATLNLAMVGLAATTLDSSSTKANAPIMWK